MLCFPFKPFGTPLFEVYDFSETCEDSMIVCKEKYPHYDVVLLNVFNSIFIDLVNVDLHQ